MAVASRPILLTWRENRHPACHGRRASSLSFQARTGGTRCLPSQAGRAVFRSEHAKSAVLGSLPAPPWSGRLARRPMTGECTAHRACLIRVHSTSLHPDGPAADTNLLVGDLGAELVSPVRMLHHFPSHASPIAFVGENPPHTGADVQKSCPLVVKMLLSPIFVVVSRCK